MNNDVISVEHVWPGAGSFGLNMIKGTKGYMQIVCYQGENKMFFNFHIERLKQMISELEKKYDDRTSGSL